MEDVFKKETQKIVGSFSNAKKAPKRKTSKVANNEWTEALAASDKGSYSEQDKMLELDGLDKEDEVVPVFSAIRFNICPIFSNMRCHVF